MADGSRNEDQEEQPAWLNTENDDQHRAEVEPLLFGTGPLDLVDPQQEDDGEQHHGDDNGNEFEDESDLETAVLSAASGNSKKTYGSTASSPTSKSTGTPSPSPSKMWSKAKDKLWPMKRSEATKKKTTTPTKEKHPNQTRFQETEEEYDEDEANPWHKSQITYSEKNGRPDRPHRPWCLDMFYFVEAFAILTCLSLVVSQTLPLTLVPLKEIEPVDVVLKIYISLFSILFMVSSSLQQYTVKTYCFFPFLR
jgi:hypothetical protein